MAIKSNEVLIHAPTEVSYTGPHYMIPFNVKCLE